MATGFGVGKNTFWLTLCKGHLDYRLGEQLELGLLVAFVGD